MQLAHARPTVSCIHVCFAFQQYLHGLLPLVHPVLPVISVVPTKQLTKALEPKQTVSAMFVLHELET